MSRGNVLEGGEVSTSPQTHNYITLELLNVKILDNVFHIFLEKNEDFLGFPKDGQCTFSLAPSASLV